MLTLHQVVTKATYKTYPAIRQIVHVLLDITYTEASYRSFLNTWYGMQSALTTHNFSGYMWPSPTGFAAQLLVHNSGDLSGANETLQPLYNFAEQEASSGRPFQIQNQANVLPSYFSLFPAPSNQVTDQAGSAGVGGSRLLPLSVFQDSVNALVDISVNSPSLQIFLGKRLDSSLALSLKKIRVA